MKLTPWMLTVAAFMMIVLLTAGFFVKKLLAREVPVPPQVASRLLPMAITDIDPGTLITRAHVGNGPWSDPDLASDTMLSVDSVVGRIARERISAAQPLRGAQFYAPGDYPELKVGHNMRAVTINVGDETAMVNGLIKPGQYVDVNLTVDQTNEPAARSTSTADGAMTLTLFEGVKVIALNRSNSQNTSVRNHNVTLELDESQARIMLLASQKGTVALSFNPNGPGQGGVHVEGDTGRVTLRQILGMNEKEQEKPFLTEQYRAGGVAETWFEDDRRVQYNGGNDTNRGGTPLQSPGGGWNWNTSTDQKNRVPDISRAAGNSSI